MSRIAIACTFIALTACSTSVERGAAKAPSAEAGIALPNDVTPGALLRESELFSDAQGGNARCIAPSGQIAIRAFRHHRYAVEWITPFNCGGSVPATSGWVNESDVDYAGAALEPLLILVTPSSSLSINMAYASNKIFCDSGACKITEPLYGKNRCYLAPEAALALERAQVAAVRTDRGLSLKLLDCYRPVAVQIEMFKQVNDPVWVARPAAPRFGGHNRGIAVDLTLERDGLPLDMGGSFDAFSAVSQYDYPAVSATAKRNRTLLREIMIAAGFKTYDAEWWHFYVPGETRAMGFPL
ncbi:MAG: M15 family metallopeptidase [Casimicrobium sp.]|jgi:D-alanyl-D-alanine dipeptidase